MKHLENTVVHCPTEELANKVLKKANSEGFIRLNGKSFLEDNKWGKNRENTCYNLLEGMYGSKEYFEKINCIIITAQEYLDMEINLDNYEPKGQLRDIPKPIIKKMLENQRDSGNDVDVSVFEKDIYTNEADGGFVWENFEGVDFWNEILICRKIKLFFETYPEEKEKSNSEFDLMVGIQAKSDFKNITDSIASLLEYKNSKYGNSALEPLNIFSNKCKTGQRLDDKLSRIKNSKKLRKNDVADVIGYLILTCKEKGWNNFEDLKD